ncbi:MAG: anti-sigma factor family protein [Phycisphaerales bacterium JB040]
MTRGQGDNPTPRLGRIPDSLIDAVIDGDLDPRAQREILAAARRHPEQRRELAETTQLLRAFRSPLAAPDLTDAIVHEAHRRRRYIPARVQRLVTRSRLAVAASVLLALTAYVGATRAFPDASLFQARNAPVSSVAENVATEAGHFASVASSLAAAAPRREALPTAGAIVRVEIEAVSPAPAHAIAFDPGNTGFFTFQMPETVTHTTRHDATLTPAIHFVGSAAIRTQPTPDLDRVTELP